MPDAKNHIGKEVKSMYNMAEFGTAGVKGKIKIVNFNKYFRSLCRTSSTT
jgi:hypothetical protein